MKKKGIESSLGFLHEYSEGVASLDDIYTDELPVYHVVLIVDDVLYDGTGIIDHDYLVQFAYTHYGDSSPNFFSHVDLDFETSSFTLSETDWSIDPSDFLHFFESI